MLCYQPRVGEGFGQLWRQHGWLDTTSVPGQAVGVGRAERQLPPTAGHLSHLPVDSHSFLGSETLP